MGPFDTVSQVDERRLRFDVLKLAYQMQSEGLVETGEDSVLALASTLMSFVDGQEVTV